MKNRTRITNILIAGTLTAMILIVFLGFKGVSTAIAKANSTDQTADVQIVGDYNTDVAALEAQIESLQAQNNELRSAVQTMQEREAEYQNQIDMANETISELSAQNNSLAAGIGGFNNFQSRPEGRFR